MSLNLKEIMPELYEPLSEASFKYSAGKIYFARGRFDAYCVWVAMQGKKRAAPRDSEYFGELLRLGQKHGYQKAYRFFQLLFLLVKDEKEVTYSGLAIIHGYVKPWFGSDAAVAEQVYFSLYFGMVAEEKKKNTKLGAHIKHLGVHQVLLQQIPVETAANYSKGKRWQEIQAECDKWGLLYKGKAPTQKESGLES